MKLGIVGSEGKKFTPETEERARAVIRCLLAVKGGSEVTHVYSGDCHLGGVDIFAEEEAKKAGVPFTAFPPKVHSWEEGYKPRNIQIAEASDMVVCITVRGLPDNYRGMRFPGCYHCRTTDHVKSGGCWTVKYAKKIGKEGEVIVIDV